jgi:hypothetical protein
MSSAVFKLLLLLGHLVEPVPQQHSQVRPEKSPFPLGQSQQYLQPLPQLQGSVNTWQAPAQPYQDLLLSKESR